MERNDQDSMQMDVDETFAFETTQCDFSMMDCSAIEQNITVDKGLSSPKFSLNATAIIDNETNCNMTVNKTDELIQLNETKCIENVEASYSANHANEANCNVTVNKADDFTQLNETKCIENVDALHSVDYMNEMNCNVTVNKTDDFSQLNESKCIENVDASNSANHANETNCNVTVNKADDFTQLNETKCIENVDALNSADYMNEMNCNVMVNNTDDFSQLNETKCIENVDASNSAKHANEINCNMTVNKTDDFIQLNETKCFENIDALNSANCTNKTNCNMTVNKADDIFQLNETRDFIEIVEESNSTKCVFSSNAIIGDNSFNISSEIAELMQDINKSIIQEHITVSERDITNIVVIPNDKSINEGEVIEVIDLCTSLKVGSESAVTSGECTELKATPVCNDFNTITAPNQTHNVDNVAENNSEVVNSISQNCNAIITYLPNTDQDQVFYDPNEDIAEKLQSLLITVADSKIHDSVKNTSESSGVSNFSNPSNETVIPNPDANSMSRRSVRFSLNDDFISPKMHAKSPLKERNDNILVDVTTETPKKMDTLVDAIRNCDMPQFSNSPCVKSKPDRRDTLFRLFDPLYDYNSLDQTKECIDDDAANVDLCSETHGDLEQKNIDLCAKTPSELAESDLQQKVNVENANLCAETPSESTESDLHKQIVVETAELCEETPNETEKMKLMRKIKEEKAKLSTLQMQLVEKEEFINKIQAESRKMETESKDEIELLRNQLNARDASNNTGEIIDLKKENDALKEEKAQKIEIINKNRGELAAFRQVMNEYDKFISQKVGEIEKLQCEYYTVKKHLSTLEMAFADIHTKYERCKTVVFQYKANEEAMKIALEKSNANTQRLHEKYDALKMYASEQLEKSNTNMAKLNEKYNHEMNHLASVVKRWEIKVSSLKQALEQKESECNELSALCDELQGKNRIIL